MRRRHAAFILYVAAAVFTVGAALSIGHPVRRQATPTATVIDATGVARTTTYPTRTPTSGLTSALPLTVENAACLALAALLTAMATMLLVRGAAGSSPRR